MKRAWVLVLWLFIPAGLFSSTNEYAVKGGFILNKSDETAYSWVLIHETNYFIKNLVSIGYEVQFSYFKTSDEASVEPRGISFPLNVFFNSRVKLIRKGILRPYTGIGIGILTNTLSYPDRFDWEKHKAFQLVAGLSIGMSTKASFKFEFRIMGSDKEGSNIQYLLVGGVSY
jgi:hypothetical protein